MTFADAVKSVLTVNYANFNGRASRSEYWWFALFYVIVAVVLGIVDAMLGMQILGTIFGLAVLIPSLAVGVRRLHDVGRSGWWILIAFTVIGVLLLIYWYVQPSDPAANEYGPPPAV